MRDIEKTIREVNGTMAIEGMPLTDDDKTRLRNMLLGNITIDDVIKQLTAKYTSKDNTLHE